MIRKVMGKYYVFSEKGKRLSKAYDTRAEAEKRLRQIEYLSTKRKVKILIKK